MIFPASHPILRWPLLAALLALASAALAEASGPDFFQVTGVAPDDTLNIRSAPSPRSEKIGEIPPGANCLRNLGCKDGLAYGEFAQLPPAKQKQLLKEKPRWCKVEYQGTAGWVAGRYLREGACPRAQARKAKKK